MARGGAISFYESESESESEDDDDELFLAFLDFFLLDFFAFWGVSGF